ncbi:MAG: hypothetical protein JNN15_01420 [Blastocatellia bacterium]|nr:hypothetical protein [Blastocatellia bacterium]
MREIKIEGSLNEQKLSNLLRELFESSWAGGSVELPGSSRSWETAYRTRNGTILVAYDQANHYCDTETAEFDKIEDRMAADMECTLIRFPYWLQLDSNILGSFFGKPANIITYIPHGFLQDSVLPLSFCRLGIERFENEIHSIPYKIYLEVIASLRDRVNERGIDKVLPAELYYLVG